MSGNINKQFFFEVQLNWLEAKEGVLSARDVAGTIHVATPPSFGGVGRVWSPEHLFLSSLSSCYMTTFLAFAQKLNLGVVAFDCNSIGDVDIVEGKYKFTRINMYPRIFIEDEVLREKAEQAEKKTQDYCLIAGSINATTVYHTQILAGPLSTNANESNDLKGKFVNSSAKTF